MKKLIFTAILFASFFVLAFIIPNNVDAALVYVGTKIENTQSPEGGQFCLQSGTIMSVIDTDGSTVLNAYTTTQQACAGDTIWSGLVDLQNQAQYGVRLRVPLCTDGDYREGKCWYVGQQGQSCTTVCSTHGGTASTTCNESLSQANIEDLAGITCMYTQNYCPVYYEQYYWVLNYIDCYTCLQGSTYNNCGFSYYEATRICACAMSTGTFNFPFTAYVD